MKNTQWTKYLLVLEGTHLVCYCAIKGQSLCWVTCVHQRPANFLLRRHSNKAVMRQKWSPLHCVSVITLSLTVLCVGEWQVGELPTLEWNSSTQSVFYHKVLSLPSNTTLQPTSCRQSWGLSTPENCTSWACGPKLSAPALWWSSFSLCQTEARTTSEAWACLVGWRGAWIASENKGGSGYTGCWRDGRPVQEKLKIILQCNRRVSKHLKKKID